MRGVGGQPRPARPSAAALGPRAMPRPPALPPPAGGAPQVQDMADACEYVRGLGRRVSCLLGHSKGGTNALLFAAEHHDVPKIVNLSGRFRPREGTLQRVRAPAGRAGGRSGL